MLRRNTEHRRAQAAGVVERDYALAQRAKTLAQSMHQVNLRTNSKHCSRRSLLNHLNQSLRGTNSVGLLANFKATLRVHNYLDAWILRADAIYMLRQKPLMHGAVPLPQNHPRSAQAIRHHAAVNLIRIPYNHLLRQNPHSVRRVAAQMLIRQK